MRTLHGVITDSFRISIENLVVTLSRVATLNNNVQSFIVIVSCDC